MKVSVIIPSYRLGLYVNECLSSLANQSLDKSHYEVILILNGCPEPWETDIRQFAESKLSNMNFVFIQEDIGSVSNARAIGIDVARGEYITLEELLRVSSPDSIGVARPIAMTDLDSLMRQIKSRRELLELETVPAERSMITVRGWTKT